MSAPRTVVDTDRFEAYGASHWAALAVLAAGVVVLLALSGRQQPAAAERLGRGMALAIVVITVPLQVLYATPAHWHIARTLPVQLCDVASVVAVIALWSRRRWAAGVTYFWGLTLTTQAIITPDLAAGFPHPVFLLYWAMHVLVVWAAVHLTWGLGLAPSWREYRTALAATVAWAAVVFAVNAALGTNYGFLNAKPSAPSVLDLLGPWPWYLLAVTGLITGVWALITWPWTRRAPGVRSPSGGATTATAARGRPPRGRRERRGRPAPPTRRGGARAR